MIAVRLIRWIGGIAGLGALTLGLLFWIAQIDLISIHMLFGLIVTLSLLVLGIMGVFTRGLRLLGGVSIVYALGIPIFGLSQVELLIGNIHWLIQAAHLFVGLGALTLIGVLSKQYLHLKRTALEVPTPQTAR